VGLGAPRKGIATIVPKVQLKQGYGIYEAYYSGGYEQLDVGAMEFTTSLLRTSAGEGTTSAGKVKWPSTRWVSDSQQLIMSFGYKAVEDIRVTAVNTLQYSADWDPNAWYPGEYVYGKSADINYTVPFRLKMYTVKNGEMNECVDVVYPGGSQPRLSSLVKGMDLWAGDEVVFRLICFSQHSSLRKDRFVSWVSYDHMWYPATLLLDYESLRENKSPSLTQGPVIPDFSALDTLEEDCGSLENPPVTSTEIEEDDD
jgi:hypothetical protein